MGKQVLLLLMALSVATSAAAQTKFTGKVHCAKADPDYSIEVGDKPGHVLTARKSACTWTESTDIARTQGQECAGRRDRRGQRHQRS